MAKLGKRLKDAHKDVDRQKLYPVSAGSHTAHVLYKHNSGSFTASFTLFNPAIK